MPSSLYMDILNAVAGIVGGLQLTFAGRNPTVEVLKEPKVQEFLETLAEPGEAGATPLPVIAVAPTESDQFAEPASTEGYVFTRYPVDVVISAGGNRDFQANLDVWLDWRQQIRLQFQGTTLQGVPAVYNVNTSPDPAIDRETLQENYDRGKLTLWFDCLEVRDGPPVTTTSTTSTTTTTTTTT